MTAVSGAALTAIFFFPKESDMCRLSAKFRVLAQKFSSLWSRTLLSIHCCFSRSAKDSTSSRAETWLTVYRPYEVEFKMACQKLGQMVQKNEDISESVNSFDMGAIFPTEVGQDLSRNAFVASILSLERNPQWRKDFLHDSEIDKNFEKVLSGKPKLNFSGLPGAHAPQGCIRLTTRYPHDS